MISHEFTQISEGFRASDESDLIGSKLLHSPRSKGDFMPMKYSNSFENARYFPNYAEKLERQNPQNMKVITFQHEPKAQVQASKLVVAATENNQTNGKRGHVAENGKKERDVEEEGRENEQKQQVVEGGLKRSTHLVGEITPMIIPEVKTEVVSEKAKENKENDQEKERIQLDTEKPVTEPERDRLDIVNHTDHAGVDSSEGRVQEKQGTNQENNIKNKNEDETGAEQKEDSNPANSSISKLNGGTKEGQHTKGNEEENGKIEEGGGDEVPEKPITQPSPPLSAKATTDHELHQINPSKSPPSQTTDTKTASKGNGEVPKIVEPAVKSQAEPGQTVQAQSLQLVSQPSLGAFDFSKDLGYKAKVTVSTSPSALSMSLTERSQKVKGFQGSRLQIPDYHVPCLQLVVFILIHSSYLPNKLSNLRVPPNATVEYVIDIAVKKLNDLIEKHRPEDPLLVPSKCQLLLAEDDGRPDTDTPVLQRDAAVHRFGCMFFALCKDPESEGGFSADSKTFKVLLPTKEYQVLSHKRSLSLGQVLEIVCNKRQLDPLVHYMVYTPPAGGKEVEIDNLDTLVSDIEVTEVTIKCRMSSRKITKNPLRPTLRSKSRHDVFSLGESGQDSALTVLNDKVSRHLGVPKEFFWSPAAVSTYVQYPVIKINKYGKKQERVMGIDRERITNSMPLNRPSIKTNRPTRMMADVVKAFITDRPVPASPSSRKPFSIEFVDHIQEYEAEKADEIVARINYIISLETATPVKGKSLQW